MSKELETILQKLISIEELQAIFGSEEKEKNGIKIGEVVTYDPILIDQIFSILTQRIDKLIEYDLEINNGSLSEYGQIALSIRGFTLPEFRDLFSKFISVDEFVHYPIFHALKLRGKPILTEKSREEVLAKYSDNDVQENYIKALCESGYQQHYQFFFEWIKYSVWIPLSKIKQHIHIVGATGSGKTWLLSFIGCMLLKKYPNYGFCLVDVHGDISKIIKKYKIFAKDPDRLIYIDPFGYDGYTPTFNFFEFGGKSNKDKSFLVENFIEAFENSLERDEKRSEVQIRYLEKMLYFLVERGNATLQDLADLLNVKEEIFTEAQEYNPDFFDANFAKHTNKTRTSLRDRIERMITNPTLKNFFCGKSTFDFESAINSNKIVLFNFGNLPTISAKVAGKFVLGYFKTVIRARQKGQYKGLNFLMLDECQTLVKGNDAFNHILAELRGFALSVICANQYSNQLGEQKETVRQNTSVKIVGGFDEPEDINAVVKLPPNTPQLKDYQFYLKVRHRKVKIFSTPKKFVMKRHKYNMSKEREREIDLEQRNKYYRVIGQSNFQSRLKVETTSKKATQDAPIPPFQIKNLDTDVQPIQ